MVTDWVQEFIPFASDFVKENLAIVFSISNIVGVIAIVGLVWSAQPCFIFLFTTSIYPGRVPKPSGRQESNGGAGNHRNAVAGLVLSTMVSTFVDVLNNLLPFLDLLETPL